MVVIATVDECFNDLLLTSCVNTTGKQVEVT